MTMPAGEYWVGDLCYVLDAEWNEVCDLLTQWEQENPDNSGGAEFVLGDGRRFAIYTTRWGDGVYKDMQGREYGVDSGTLGCVQVVGLNPDDVDRDLGSVINFRNDFETGYTDKDESVIKFGHIQIDTDAFED